MTTQRLLTSIGHNILIIVDKAPGFRAALCSVLSSLPDLEQKTFTLLYCCPPHYWEHGGAQSLELQHEIEDMMKVEDDAFNQAETCSKRVKAVLRDMGVLDANIQVKVSTDDSLILATMNELKHNHYTGVIVSTSHQDIVARLLRRGITDMFRKIPEVEVLTLDLAAEMA